MTLITAPTNIDPNDCNHLLFLGGGITNCPDWQSTVVDMLKDVPELTLINPRQQEYDMSDTDAGTKQISWEHSHLSYADTIVFWFCAETMCPITLFELGKWMHGGETLANVLVGIDPGYARKHDIEVQLGLDEWAGTIVYSLEDLCSQIIEVVGG